MSELFGINTFDLFFFVFKLPLALLVGLGSAFIFFRQSLEARLRQRRSPGAVRFESVAWALAIGGLIPCITGGYGIGIFALFFLGALMMAIFGRGGWQTWAMLGVTVVLSIGAFALHLTYTGFHSRVGSHSTHGGPVTANTPVSTAPVTSSTNSTGSSGGSSPTNSAEAPK